jgi:TolB-like protein/Tfp pilus assembly protein PilF
VAVPKAAPDQPGERGDAPSLAVMPFTNRSGLPEDEVFASGMVEDLIDALSRGVYARVIASSVTARFRIGVLPDIAALGRELNVRYLLEGNIRRSGSNLRVTAQLVEAASGAIVWTERFDRPLSELAHLQEDLIVEVAAHLGTQLFRAGIEDALRRPAGLTAWERVTRSLAAIRVPSADSLTNAIDEASKAVAIDPGYGLAHAVLADILAMQYNVFRPDNPDEVSRIRYHIDRALACDGNAVGVLAHVAYAFCNIGQPQEGLQRAKRSIAASPGYGFPYLPAGVANIVLNQAEAALGLLSDFRQFEPNSPHEHYAYAWDVSAHLHLGDWAAALRANAKCLELNYDAFYAHGYRAMITAQLGRADEARESMREARRREPTATLAMWELRLTRWTADAPIRQQLLSLLRTVWAEVAAEA